MAGKGITLGIIFKFIFYILLIAIPKALPIAVLLSSIMLMGQLSENYEFAAIKSAGVSLNKLLLPLYIFIFALSLINIVFLNDVYPWANLKQKNLVNNIKKKQPALALVPGTFNSDLPNFVIKFDEKYGKEKNMLKNVLIYQSKIDGNINTITAKKGILQTEEGSKYMSLKLEDGFFYEEHSHGGSIQEVREKAPFSTTHFDTYTVNVDISKFSDNDLEEERYRSDRQMLNFHQLEIYSDSLKVSWNEYINNRANNFYLRMFGNKLVPRNDNDKKITYPILSNFDLKNQADVLSFAENNIVNTINDFSNFSGDYKYRRKALNFIDTEFHSRIAIAFSALLLFFIGAPLGALIKKGGFGLPMVFAIIIYMTYHFLSSFSGNMAEESTVNHFWGGWLSTAIFIPLAIYLIISVSKDKSTLNIGYITDKFGQFFSKFMKNEDETPMTNHH